MSDSRPAAMYAVRPARLGDLPGVVRLWADVVGEGRWLGSEGPVDGDERLEQLARSLADERQATFVAVTTSPGEAGGRQGGGDERGGEGERGGGDRGDRRAAVDAGGGDGGPGGGERRGGELVGSLGIQLRPYDVAELGMLVAAGWRGRGVGSGLLRAAIDWARQSGAHKVALQAWPHNEPALALYRKFGFAEEGRLRRHYRRRNGELWDAVVMGLVLDETSPGPPPALRGP